MRRISLPQSIGIGVVIWVLAIGWRLLVGFPVDLRIVLWGLAFAALATFFWVFFWLERQSQARLRDASSTPPPRPARTDSDGGG